jgi:glutamate carboxypeptidase
MLNSPSIETEEILEGIRSWVEIETPSDNPEAVNRLVGVVEAEYERLGARVERIPGRDGYGDHLKVRTPWGEDGEKGILVLCHLDTVHPMGTLKLQPYKVEGDVAYGPGIYDMKGGAYLGYYAFRHLMRLGQRTKLPITFLYVSDEEVGSPTSRAHIEAAARDARYVLVTEPARDGGKVVTARKGVARFDMKITGIAAHAGAKHEDGRSAIRELARQILELEAMTDYAAGVTVNVGVVAGGTRANVIAAEASAQIDMRVPTIELGEKLVDKILNLKPFDPDVRIEVTGELNRPPFEKSEAGAALFGHAQIVAKEIGIDLQDLKTGGGSDGNFTAPFVPTLDGLGVDGKGAHTNYEQLYISSLAPRSKLLLRLFETLE